MLHKEMVRGFWWCNHLQWLHLLVCSQATVRMRREGQVLGRGMLLKYDTFPTGKMVATDASNYRRIDERLPLCAGTAVGVRHPHHFEPTGRLSAPG